MHGRLLENLLVYCAFGWPDVGLVELEGDEQSRARVRDVEAGMAMWATRSVRVTVPKGAQLPIDAWPLRGVKRIVAPAALAPKEVHSMEGAPAWFRRGGELVRIADNGETTTTAQLNDRFLVLRQWAMWFGGLPEQAWLDRLSLARAVLRLLDEVARPEWLALAQEDVRFKVAPSEYADEVRGMLASRLRNGNVDETISATTAALDLDRLIDERALSRFQRGQARRWLRDHLQVATRADQLDILRCLADPGLLQEYLDQWSSEWDTDKPNRRVDGLVATRLREAVHACWPNDDEPRDLLPDSALTALDGDQVADDLSQSPLLSADFLAAQYSPRPSDDPGVSKLFDPLRFPRSIEAAVDRVGAAGLFVGAPDVRAVCAHTLAILRHLGRHPAGLRFLADRGELPSSAAESVLQEASRARDSEREARRDLPALGRAVLALGAVTLGLAAVGLLDLWRLAGITVSIRPWWLVAPALLVPAVALIALRWIVLKRLERRQERRDLRLGQSVMATAALALSLVTGTLAWRLGAPEGGVTAFSLAVGPLVGATAFALVLFVLRHWDLAPGWATRVPSLVGDIKAPLAFLTKKLTEPHQDQTPPRP
jgi:hypothetical protein